MADATDEKDPPPAYAPAAASTTAATSLESSPPPAAPAPAPSINLTALAVPPTLTSPVYYHTSVPGCLIVYDAPSLSYHYISPAPATIPGGPSPGVYYSFLHHVPSFTIPKSTGTKFLQSSASLSDIIARLPSAFPKFAPSPHPTLLPDAIVVLNALHDSILVRRNSGDKGGLAQLFSDKWVSWRTQKHRLLFIFRPEYVLSCTCSELESVSDVLYCKGCTTYYRCTITTSADGRSATRQVTRITTVGTLALSWLMSGDILLAMCGGTNRLVMDRAMAALGHLFILAQLGGVGLPREQMLYWALRDSLFVAFPQIKVNWYDQYFAPRTETAAQGGNGVNGAAAAIGLARLGLAIATLGMIS